jgi:hypothetical protein
MKMVNSAVLKILAALSFVLALALTAAPAQAQATRTWVSGVGDDVNPCSRTAPCKTFAGAISKTAAGGEINCLDPGGFGTVTITKSITIDCEDTQGSILASSTNGVNVNDSATGTPNTIKVILRGLSINGAGTTPGLTGVNFVSGSTVTIEKCIIQNFLTSPSGGVRVTVSGGTATLFISDTTIANNGTGVTGGGVEIRPSGTGAVRADLVNVRFANNASSGFRIDSSATSAAAGVVATISNSTLAGSSAGLTAVSNAVPTTVTVIDSDISLNSGFGAITNGVNTRVRFVRTTISNNATGLSQQGGSFGSDAGGSLLIGNTNNGTFN